MANPRLTAACWVVRLALAASFLSAVADRLGLRGVRRAARVFRGEVWGGTRSTLPSSTGFYPLS